VTVAEEALHREDPAVDLAVNQSSGGIAALFASILLEAAKVRGVPVELLDLRGESHARTLYERDLVLVRPDEHVAWRGNGIESDEEAMAVWECVSGWSSRPVQEDGAIEEPSGEVKDNKVDSPRQAFTATVEMTTQTDRYEMAQMGELQQ
jgi:hypothetical protein